MSDEKSAVQAAIEKANKWHTPLSGVTLADVDEMSRKEIVERCLRHDDLIAAVKALLPYAESRAEDLSDLYAQATLSADARAEETQVAEMLGHADKAWKAVGGAQALLVELSS